MRLTCHDCGSECGFEEAMVPVRDQELKCPDCEHAWFETAVLHRTQGPGVTP